MLLHRIITGIILIILALLVLFVFPSFVFLWVSSLILLYGAWEWSGFMKLTSFAAKMAYLILIFLIGILFESQPSWLVPLIVLALVWWLWHSLLIISYPRGTRLWSPVWMKGLTGLLVLVPCWLSINLLYGMSPWLMFILFLIIWGSDTMAYFSGRRWGKRKLLPAVSPGKSWAGFWGALVTTVILALVCLQVVPQFRSHRLFIFGLFVLTMLFSVLGDLVESLYKRHAGLKDSGNVLPGHGGLLDRIDSLTAAAPLFCVGLLFIL